MEESFTDKLILQEKKNEYENVLNNTSIYDSSDYHPDEFGLGIFSGKVLEEIKEEHDSWENFMTTMFLIGIILIPIQLIFSDKIKSFDIKIIKFLQKNLKIDFFLQNKIILNSILFFSNINFYLSIVVLFYLSFDSGIAFKTSLISNIGIFFVFVFKLIIHDSRPFWIDSEVKNYLCKLSFGSPSIDIFVGMLSSHYLYFCSSRALQSDDHFINKSRYEIIFSEKLSFFLIGLNFFNGIFYVLIGTHFIYQILVSYFYGFILIRIVIIFNKEIDSFSNGARFIISISNLLSIYVMFIVTILSIISSITYSIVKDDLIIPREWEINISKKCNININSFNKLSIKYTFLESSLVFNILGSTMGINFLLKHLKNYHLWIVSKLFIRIGRGIIGFFINLNLLYLIRFVNLNILINTYILYIIVYSTTGFISYGILPIFFSYINMTNLITPIEEKKLKEKKKFKEFQEDNNDFFLETETMGLTNEGKKFESDNNF